MKIYKIVLASLFLLVGTLAFGAYNTQADKDKDDKGFNVKPFEFVGTAAQCSPSPAGTPIVGAAWVKHFGLSTGGDNKREALFLSKNGPTGDCSSAGAEIKGVKGITLTELGFDQRNGGHCGAGATRFNVQATDGFHFMGGCANATQTPATPQAGWMRIRIDPSNPTQAFPVITPGATIISISLLFDEGVDIGPDFSGIAVLDNIDINGALIGRHGGGDGDDD